MPKMRTHKSTAKRFRATASGKLIARHTHQSHLLTHKSAARKRRLGRPMVAAAGDMRRLGRMLPYAGK